MGENPPVLRRCHFRQEWKYFFVFKSLPGFYKNRQFCNFPPDAAQPLAVALNGPVHPPVVWTCQEKDVLGPTEIVELRGNGAILLIGRRLSFGQLNRFDAKTCGSIEDPQTIADRVRSYSAYPGHCAAPWCRAMTWIWHVMLAALSPKAPGWCLKLRMSAGLAQPLPKKSNTV
ncbi:hypothetical protein [Thalassospira sp. TSL5-1]|uniref:hypothetical protein n=1 Tax=Thalassospira sp. TSL5-1 TaxID=1544451 RepID=UPI001160FFD5|nr:hypothetical protein [Thalassospira sp. TSL5-1]